MTDQKTVLETGRSSSVSTRRFSGFSLVELLVVIGIVAVLAAILFPVLAQSRGSARTNVCLSNLKQLGLAIEMYAQDYDGRYPMSRMPDQTHPESGCDKSIAPLPESGLWGTSVNWKRVIFPYLKNTTVFACPSNSYQWSMSGYALKVNVPGDETNYYYPKEQQLPASYAMNGSYFHEAIPPCWEGEDRVRSRYLSELKTPANLILLLESRYSFPDFGNWNLGGKAPNNALDGPIQTHNGVSNWLFADLHVKALPVAKTCHEKMWTDEGKTGKIDGCATHYPAPKP